MITNTKMISFKDFSDGRGHLTPIESMRDLPFSIRRIYYITGVPENQERGFHSHRNLEQVMLCLYGSIKVRIQTPYESEIVQLESPLEGLYIGNMVWREMFDFSEGAVLLVLASEFYRESDYIRDYEDYLMKASVYFQRKEEFDNVYSVLHS